MDFSEVYSTITKTRRLDVDTDYPYEFIDDNFDPYASAPSTPVVSNSSLDQFLIDSYYVSESFTGGGWQRDNIYYGLNKTIQSGKVTGKYREYITNFAWGVIHRLLTIQWRGILGILQK
jgi:hypothetical protein